MAPPPVIRLHPDDGVVIARATLLAGAPVADAVVAAERIPAGHKVAVRPIAAGEPVRRYGQIIGFASKAIAPGQHVHVQNCGMGDFAKDYAYALTRSPPTLPTRRPASRASAGPMAAWRHATTSAS
jgi:altronate hydrolase